MLYTQYSLTKTNDIFGAKRKRDVPDDSCKTVFSLTSRVYLKQKEKMLLVVPFSWAGFLEGIFGSCSAQSL